MVCHSRCAGVPVGGSLPFQSPLCPIFDNCRWPGPPSPVPCLRLRCASPPPRPGDPFPIRSRPARAAGPPPPLSAAGDQHVILQQPAHPFAGAGPDARAVQGDGLLACSGGGAGVGGWGSVEAERLLGLTPSIHAPRQLRSCPASECMRLAMGFVPAGLGPTFLGQAAFRTPNSACSCFPPAEATQWSGFVLCELACSVSECMPVRTCRLVEPQTSTTAFLNRGRGGCAPSASNPNANQPHNSVAQARRRTVPASPAGPDRHQLLGAAHPGSLRLWTIPPLPVHLD